ncbi:MAG: ABC transporter permease [Clostridium sp.]|uniref:ABC transporter permease n=1 Tax=Bacillota TaxID=1239 RepID=UPI0006C6DA69|nr:MULTISPECIES: ABC transporter permease [Bacillota]MCG3603220.1 ABC transporter permease [Clostridioides difficile]MCW0696997.1 ABC transporter permease [Clostridioides difficile]MDU1587268.1 ABC transporter permease [Clostridium sp.]MDY6494055.1 ABC transporter permease [Clostridioides difficile]MDY6661057.1 ABC transporter permease [Clostridioides difficile]
MKKDMLRNSLLYIKRKKKKSIIVLFILTAILISLYTCLSINKFSNNVESIIYRAANSSFILKSKNSQELIDTKEVEGIKNLDRINEYNLEYETLAQLKGDDVFGGEQKVEISNLNSEYENLLKIYGVRDSSLSNDFTSEVFKIVEGRHIGKDDKNKIIVHEELAKQNQYELGDKVSIKQIKQYDPDDEDINSNIGLENEYEIVGIFSGKKQESYTGFSSDYSENMAFIDYSSSQKISGIDSNYEKLNQATYFVNSPENMDKVISSIKNMNINWSNIDLEKNTKIFDDISTTVGSIKGIIQIITYSIIVGGCIVLSLILILWLRERIYEIGILLSIGIGKREIIGQFILELVFISIPSLFISTLIGNLVTRKILSEIILKEKIISTLSNASNKIFGSENIFIICQSYGLLILIILLSVLITSGIILMKKPKEILSKMS